MTPDEARLRELADELRVSWSDRGWVAAKKISGLLAEAREAANGLDALLDALSAERERGDRGSAAVAIANKSARGGIVWRTSDPLEDGTLLYALATQKEEG